MLVLVCPYPPLVPGGGAHSLVGEGEVVVPIPTRGHTLWYSVYLCTLWCQDSMQRSTRSHVRLSLLNLELSLRIATSQQNSLKPEEPKADCCFS